MSVMNATSVDAYSFGIAVLFQMSPIDELVASGSVMTATTGSSLPGIGITGFTVGTSGAGIELKVFLIFCSIMSTSKSPTTITACMSGLYHLR